jgi:RNA polymerase sigma-70 factor (ECF subfamily)
MEIFALPESVGAADPPADEPDAELWRLAAKGDHAAFAALFERYAQAVWNHAYRLTGSWTQADDISAATFLAAWRKRRDVNLVRDSALPWLYAVAGNLVRNERRSSTRFLRALRRIPVDGATADHADAVAGRVDDDRRMRRVVEAVRTLSPGERAAFELCLLGDISPADTAVVLGISEATLRTRLSRARARIRTYLEEQP